MDWLRRNWPDLIIAVALVAVIAMIVATLLGGSPLLSFGGQGGDAGGRPTEQPPAAQGSQNPGRDAEQNTGQNAQQNSESPAGANNNAQQAGIEPVVPDLPNEGASANAPENADDAQAGESTPAQDAGQAADNVTGDAASGAADATTDDSAAAGTGETPAAEPIEGASYRVSVGAFASREGAQNLTERYSGEGLPTFIASQGDLSLALVGPYATEEEANRVAQQIIEAGGEALVYSYEPDVEEATGDAASTSDATASQSDSTTQEDTAQASGEEISTPTSTDTSTDTAQTSGTFLQAGAFGSSDSAQSRREQIEELGYATSEREATTGLVRLFVGPFGPNEIEEAQARLQTLGIDSFPVTLP